MGKLTIYGNLGSTCTKRVLLTLAEKNVTDFEFKSVDFSKGEHKSPEYIEKHQPFGQVPVLYDDDLKIFESRAIARYIADTVEGGQQLFPKDAKTRALIEQWISVESSHGKSVETIVAELVFKKWYGSAADPKVVEENSKKLHAFLAAFDKQLIGKSYLVGNDFTLAGKISVLLNLLIEIFRFNIYSLP